MKDNISCPHRKAHVLLFCFFLAAVIVAVLLFEAECFHIPYSGNTAYQEHNWLFGEKGGELSPTNLEDRHLFEPGRTYVLTTELTYTGENDQYPCALIATGNVEVRAYLDSELMFHYTEADRGFPDLNALGGADFSISLGKNCSGRQLSLEMSTPMDYSSQRRLPTIMFGDYASMMHALLLQYLPGTIISAAITCIVVILIFLGGSLLGNQWTYIHFAAFAVLIVLYRATQNLYLLYMWGNPYMTLLMEHFSIVACPIPLLLSYRSRLKPRFTGLLDGMICLGAINLSMQLVLHFTGVLDVIDMMTPTHIMLLLTSVVLGYIGFSVRKQPEQKHIFYKLLPIMIGAIMDLGFYYWHRYTIGPGSFFSMGSFIGLGLIVCLVVMVLEARNEHMRIFREREQHKLLEKLAYQDALTGLGNRAAFDREINDILKNTSDDASLLVVSADLNGLKQTNDTLGHAAGDALIQRAANLISDYFLPYGSVFRTGGDEFFAFLYGIKEVQWPEMLAGFRQLLAERNKTEELPLSIAVGYAVLGNSGISQCLQTADQRMYENKSLAHAQMKREQEK